MMDMFMKAMGEVAETKLSEIPEVPKFFDELSETQEDPDSPVAMFESKSYSGEELLSTALTDPKSLMDEAISEFDAIQIQGLCEQISDRANSFEEFHATGGLLPEYQHLMVERGYESENEMCNIEGLNWDEIYDNEPSFYGDEYKKGFIDSINQDMSPYTISEDQYNEAYYRGIIDAHLLGELMI